MTQDKALEILQSGKNVFLTGSAGTGKTYILNQYIKYLKDRNIHTAITASTGIAATHINGNTIHSWAGIGIKESLSLQDLKNMRKKKYLVNNLEDVEVLIIDEISMLHGKQLGLVNQVLQYFKQTPEAFGGIQIVLCGDFFQLPPIGNDEERNRDKFAFMHPSWVDAKFAICYLTKQYRQQNNALTTILNEIRNNNISAKSLQLLDEAQHTNLDTEEPITRLFTHNVDVDRLNNEYLQALSSKHKTFKAFTKGNEKLVEALKKSVQANETLALKKGAKVMFVKNNPDKGYINGTVGSLLNFDEDGKPIVKLKSGKTIKAEPEKWEVLDDAGKSLAAYEQVPLRLAWAITIHKSQGMTLSEAEIDLGKTFEKGQGYVALSRLTDLSGLRLTNFNDTALAVDSLALKADKRFLELSNEAEVLQTEILKKQALDFIKQCGGISDPDEIKRQRKKSEDKANRKKKGNTYEITKDLINQKMSLAEIAEERGMSAGTIATHLFKIHELFPETDLSRFKPKKEVFTPIEKAYKKLLKEHKGEESLGLKPIFEALNGKVSYDDIKLSLLFVKSS